MRKFIEEQWAALLFLIAMVAFSTYHIYGQLEKTNRSMFVLGCTSYFPGAGMLTRETCLRLYDQKKRGVILDAPVVIKVRQPSS